MSAEAEILLDLGFFVIVCILLFLDYLQKKKRKSERKELRKDKHLILTKDGELFELTNSYYNKQYNETGYFGIKYDFHKRKNYYVKSKKGFEQAIRESEIIKRFDTLNETQEYVSAK